MLTFMLKENLLQQKREKQSVCTLPNTEQKWLNEKIETPELITKQWNRQTNTTNSRWIYLICR